MGSAWPSSSNLEMICNAVFASLVACLTDLAWTQRVSLTPGHQALPLIPTDMLVSAHITVFDYPLHSHCSFPSLLGDRLAKAAQISLFISPVHSTAHTYSEWRAEWLHSSRSHSEPFSSQTSEASDFGDKLSPWCKCGHWRASYANQGASPWVTSRGTLL